ncbi:class I SAM-dependent methyltransferase [Roseomonas sp. GC11]|uniref:class I SAM-dependent methyltransferase n=1 Tax=Roseomonas sp. GC11 TaxID=2950546 RepID=UPI00210B31E6|nr:class I SAM-dependent methyltransferase [Roseomonas sp. GC11]MCQ4161100.1 class I SAM-dependent methyltransferase [Roseomonas sp. GC11]
MTDGWDESAAAWIADMGEAGDYAREWVLDRPMLALCAGARRALDVGCGEGRFCRLLRARGTAATGIDPTAALLATARARDPEGDYRTGRAEALDFPDASFDRVISYLTLIDIPDLRGAVAEMARVLAPGGQLVIANLNPFLTAAAPEHRIRDASGAEHLRVDRYLEARAEWVGWRGIRIRNWHRPMQDYMAALLEQGLRLRHFAEPAPWGGDPERAARYRGAPWFHVMAWEKD